MGKWINEYDEIQVNEDIAVGYALSTDEATRICAIHNADIERLEAERDDLKAKLDAATQPGIVWNTNMDEATKDGTRVLVAWSHSLVPEHMQYETVRWNPTEDWWVSGYCCILPSQAFAWAPLNWPEVQS